MKIYNYDPHSLDFIGSSEASIDPLETAVQGADVYLVPAHATKESPPSINEGQRARYLQNEWVVEDIPPAVEKPVAAKTFAELKELKVLEINMQYEITMSALPLDPPKERETYAAQYLEAMQWQINNAFPTPMIDALLAERQVPGEDKIILSDKIIAAATAFGSMGGAITGKRQRLVKAVESAETDEELSAIVWEAL